MNAPAVTVLLAAYNADRYVESAVGSILAQTFGDFEVLAFDDGSDDGTVALLEKLAADDPRLIVHRRPHGNFVAYFNEGLRLARGRYVARHDADDLSEPDRLARQVALLDARPEIVCVGSRMTEVDPLGVPIATAELPLEHEEIDAQLMQGLGWAMPHPAATFRREAALAIGGYREQLVTAEDLDFFLRLGEQGRLANLAEPLVRYRRHPKSVNRTRAAEQRRKVWQIVRDARARRGDADPDAGGYAALAASKVRQPSKAETIRRWGWNALRRGEVTAARRHATDLLRSNPMSPATWRLAACALRGW